MTTETHTLQQRLDATARERRWSKSMCSQAQMAVNTLNRWGNRFPAPQALIRQAVASWYAAGLAPATITKRLVALACMGLPVEGIKRPKPDRKLKWWLRPEEEQAAISWLERSTVCHPKCLLPYTSRQALKAHIMWTTRTGLRVEETLRLTDTDFSRDYSEVTVPGLKTYGSQATLPLGREASDIARALMVCHFTDYDRLEEAWSALRTAMGWPQGATLKALRRSAARYLHVDRGMPLALVMQYLRHADISTTMGYLRLTGGISTEEFRRYLG